MSTFALEMAFLGEGQLLPNEFSLILHSGALRTDNKTPHCGSSLFLLKLCQSLEKKATQWVQMDLINAFIVYIETP